jgi:hypothetical protein
MAQAVNRHPPSEEVCVQYHVRFVLGNTEMEQVCAGKYGNGRGLCWETWKWNRVFYEYFGFLLSLEF